MGNYYSANSFCNHLIRKGAIANIANIDIGLVSSDIHKKQTYEGMYDALFIGCLTVGKAFTKSYIKFGDLDYMTSLFGDPTLKLNFPYNLSEELRW